MAHLLALLLLLLGGRGIGRGVAHDLHSIRDTRRGAGLGTSTTHLSLFGASFLGFTNLLKLLFDRRGGPIRGFNLLDD